MAGNPMWIAGTSANPAGRTKGSIKKPSAVVQSLFTRVIKKRYTEEKLNDLLDHVSKRDELMFVGMMAQYTFVKPPQPDKAKDIFDTLTDEQLEKVVQMVRNDAKIATR